ncbi:MAG TPA: DUF488 family protein [Puia sp.]|nr:DUF488 family protein [Puia sp.]
MSLKIKRIYDDPGKEDGYRMLVDRLWPRGIKKTEAHLDEWNKEIAPSSNLRKKFHAKGMTFGEFSKDYRRELANQEENLDRIRSLAKRNQVTLLYGSKDDENNHAMVLQKILAPAKK